MPFYTAEEVKELDCKAELNTVSGRKTVYAQAYNCIHL